MSMRQLHPGQDAVLSWPSGALDCRVVAAAGAFVLLHPAGSSGPAGHVLPCGACSLTFLDGMIPMGFDGIAEAAGYPGELRFRVTDADREPDRRSAVRIPVFAEVQVTTAWLTATGQLLDISAGGLRFRVPGDHLESETAVHVRVALPHEGPVIDAEAVVRASEPGIASVQFTQMHGASTQEVGAWTVARLRSTLAVRA